MEQQQQEQEQEQKQVGSLAEKLKPKIWRYRGKTCSTRLQTAQYFL
jgi:hypothetical protein